MPTMLGKVFEPRGSHCPGEGEERDSTWGKGEDWCGKFQKSETGPPN